MLGVGCCGVIKRSRAFFSPPVRQLFTSLVMSCQLKHGVSGLWVRVTSGIMLFVWQGFYHLHAAPTSRTLVAGVTPGALGSAVNTLGLTPAVSLEDGGDSSMLEG